MMVYALGTGGQHLAVVVFDGIDREAPSEATGPYPRDARHHAMAVQSVSEWETLRARVSDAGASFWVESHGDQRSLYAVDPSGNVLEIATPETAPFAAPAEPPDAIVDRWIESASELG
jgi:hypothetical protein